LLQLALSISTSRSSPTTPHYDLPRAPRLERDG
jgi:hypothetical protein